MFGINKKIHIELDLGLTEKGVDELLNREKDDIEFDLTEVLEICDDTFSVEKFIIEEVE